MLTFSPSQLISESLLFGILEWFIFLFLRKSAVLWSHCLKERKKNYSINTGPRKNTLKTHYTICYVLQNIQTCAHVCKHNPKILVDIRLRITLSIIFQLTVSTLNISGAIHIDPVLNFFQFFVDDQIRSFFKVKITYPFFSLKMSAPSDFHSILNQWDRIFRNSRKATGKQALFNSKNSW